MKSFFAGAAVFLCAGSALAYEPVPDGPYASLEAGIVFMNTDEIPGFFEVDPGFLMVGAGGYAFESGLRLEGEVGWRRITTGPAITVDENTYSFYANALYEFTAGPVRPYLGAGAGVGVVDANATGLVVFHETESSFVWQLIGGLAVPLSTVTDLVADYRYTASEGLEFNGANADEDAHNITAGLRIHF